MRSLKTRGYDDVRSLRQRVVRSFALNRIGPEDYKFLLAHLKEIEARIVSMHEEAPDLGDQL